MPNISNEKQYGSTVNHIIPPYYDKQDLPFVMQINPNYPNQV